MPAVGDYTFDSSKQVAKGRHSTVYEGQHNDTGLKVAVKQVDWSGINPSKHDNVKKKLKQALEIQNKSHEHVLALLEYQEIEGDAFMVYELCDDTLENYLGTTALSEEVALDLFKQTSAIVYHKFASAQKFLLNRDVSPENILVVKNGDNVKLKFVDIALDPFADDRPMTWPNYLAPEIVANEDFVDKRKAEVFSLGLTLYRFLCARLPYVSKTELEAGLTQENAFTLPEDVQDVTDHTRSLVKRCLQPHPDNRMSLPQVLKKFGYDLPEPGSLRFSSSQGDLSPEMLLAKIEEATEEVVNLKEKIRRLEAEKLDMEFQLNIRLEQNERDSHDQTDTLNEELQTARQELSDALEQILRSDEQYDALDTRKRREIEELMQQLVQAHEALEEVARKTTEEVVTYKRSLEELKDQIETKQEEIHDAKKEHEMVEMFRQEELTSLKRELDDLTELFVQLEQSRREDDDRASGRYDEMVRLKDEEIAELRKQMSQGGGGGGSNYARSNGVASKPYTSSLSAGYRPASPSDSSPNKFSQGSLASRPLSPSPPPSKPSWSRPVSPNPPPARPSSASPEPSPISPRMPIPAQAKTWTSTQLAATNTSSTSLNTLRGPTASTTAPASKWTPPAKTTAANPSASTTSGASAAASAASPSKWTPPARTSSATSITVQKPAYMAPKTNTTPASSASSATGATAATPASATSADAYTGQLFSANELRSMLKNPGEAFQGFDKAQVEQYLDEAEFQQLLGMSKAAYNALPKWKQAPLKSKAKLF